MLEWDEEAREAKQKGQSVEEMKEILMSFAKTQNEMVRKRKEKGFPSPKFSKSKNNRLKARK